MSLRLITDAVLDAYEAGLQLATRYEIAIDRDDELDLRRVEALIADHDQQHGTQLLNDLAA